MGCHNESRNPFYEAPLPVGVQIHDLTGSPPATQYEPRRPDNNFATHPGQIPIRALGTQSSYMGQGEQHRQNRIQHKGQGSYPKPHAGGQSAVTNSSRGWKAQATGLVLCEIEVFRREIIVQSDQNGNETSSYSLYTVGGGKCSFKGSYHFHHETTPFAYMYYHRRLLYSESYFSHRCR
jgi:hypothetical protein